MAWRSVPSRLLRKVRLLERLNELDRLDRLAEALGRIESRQLALMPSRRLVDHEFSVYSQAGEDGIIQFLIRNVAIPRAVFVEFGVEDYREANTRFLAVNDRWSGLVIDSSAENVARIHASPTYWRMGVRAVHAMVTRENINGLLTDNGIAGEIGLLSIDIDGNDYWVFDAIDVISPAIVIIEYNFRFGPERSVTIPYDPTFDRARAHPSGVYSGASLRALHALATRKGYSFVGCNSFGVNAFFVRTDLLGAGLDAVDVAEGYVAGLFHESRNTGGELTHLTRAEEDAILAGLPVVEVD